MISTVTISTVSTLTTASMVGAIALIVILVLFTLLVQKELAISSSGGPIKRLSQVLNIGIIPVLISFLVLAVVKVIIFMR